jgi:hypothetical protein
MANYKLYHGVAYFPNLGAAEKVKKELETKYPEVRVVDYTRGWAVQYYKSGPYYPEALESMSTRVASKFKEGEQIMKDQLRSAVNFSDPKRIGTAADKYYKRLRDVEQQIKLLQQGIKKHEQKFRGDSRNWGYVGDLGHIYEQLSDLSGFFEP